MCDKWQEKQGVTLGHPYFRTNSFGSCFSFNFELTHGTNILKHILIHMALTPKLFWNIWTRFRFNITPWGEDAEKKIEIKIN